jgi:hypothetical protein
LKPVSKDATVKTSSAIYASTISQGGETINYLQVTSGTRIQIDQNVPEGTPCKVSIAGPAHAGVCDSRQVNISLRHKTEKRKKSLKRRSHLQLQMQLEW